MRQENRKEGIGTGAERSVSVWEFKREGKHEQGDEPEIKGTTRMNEARLKRGENRGRRMTGK